MDVENSRDDRAVDLPPPFAYSREERGAYWTSPGWLMRERLRFRRRVQAAVRARRAGTATSEQARLVELKR